MTISEEETTQQFVNLQVDLLHWNVEKIEKDIDAELFCVLGYRSGIQSPGM